MPVPKYEVRMLHKTQCVLGEGPLYEAATSTLHFVDIGKNQVLHYNIVTEEFTCEQLEEPVGCLALRKNRKGLAVAAKRGFAILHSDPSPNLQYLAEPLPELQQLFTRFNDGACDQRGRFLAGTLCHNSEPEFGGTLYSYDPVTKETTMLDDNGITDSNGLGWSADGKTLYFTNSLMNHIYAYDYDLETGVAANRRIFVDAIAQGLAPGSFCDGLCLDHEGGIWSARWGGSCIARFDKEGLLDFTVHIPGALNVTACTFGGPKNDLLYVTTAHCDAITGSSESSLQELYPDSGDLFVVDFHGRFQGGQWRFEFGG